MNMATIGLSMLAGIIGGCIGAGAMVLLFFPEIMRDTVEVKQ